MAENSSEKKPAGRPRKYSGKRPTWTIRLETSVGDQVKEMAASTGRSLSEVCEYLIGQGLLAPSRIHEMAQHIKFLEMNRDQLEHKLRVFEEERLSILENAADQFEESSEPQSYLADLIENAVERGIKRALEQKD